LLLDRIIAAADRGVRVRLLVDDYESHGQDTAFETLHSHPNIEVRVFNPFARGWMRILQFLGRFNELNRRAHNKLFVADGKVAVVGRTQPHRRLFWLGQEAQLPRLRPPGDWPRGGAGGGQLRPLLETAGGHIPSARCVSLRRRRSGIERARIPRQAQRGPGQLPLCVAA